MNISVVVTLIIFSIGWLGTLIWWGSKITSDLKAVETAFTSHVQEDRAAYTRISELTIQHAALNAKTNSLEHEIKESSAVSERILQLKLDAQSRQLIIEVRDLMHAAKREWGDEAARAAAAIVAEYTKRT